MESTGVKSTPLCPATPERGYPQIKRTPGGTKTRPVCTIEGLTFFKPLTPYSKESRVGRADVREASIGNIMHTLPKLQLRRADPVEYTATLAVIEERSGQARRQYTQHSIAQASASDVFRAHGINIIPAHSRSQHWAHLIAHFLGDTQDLTIQDNTKEIINLVPSTAAANYNTLEVIELFIKQKLTDQETDRILICVEPVYTGEALIPDLLVYSLTWVEKNKRGQVRECHETFYINPQSYHRVTKSMRQAINLLRDERDEQNDDSVVPTP